MKFKTISTLGDPPINQLTSSYYVAEKLGLADSILAYNSFENAILALKNSQADAALVAGAYPYIREFIMDSQLKCVAAFIEQIPPLVFCISGPLLPRKLTKLYLHPATLSLEEDVQKFVEIEEIVQTQATSAAASAAKNDPGSGAICNQLAADYYGLNICAVLRQGINMPFTIFQKS